MKAVSMLTSAMKHLADRAVTRDKPGGERTMAATVLAFNAAFDKDLTEEQGWQFMVILKMVRGANGTVNADDYEDEAAYAALAGEASTNSVRAKRGETHTAPVTSLKPGHDILGQYLCGVKDFEIPNSLAVKYSLAEGSQWIDIPEGAIINSCDMKPCPSGVLIPLIYKNAFAVKFADGGIFDCLEGWRF